MFTERPKIDKSSGHYAVWCWTYRNVFWQKPIPTRKSICPYCWRIGVFGLVLVMLSALYWPLRWVFYDLLFRNFARYATKHVFAGSVIVWLVVMGLLFATGLGVLLPFFVTSSLALIVSMIIFIGLVFLLIWLLKVLVTKVINPTLRFNWQVICRYYVPWHRLPAKEFRYNGRRSQVIIHLLFWIQPVVLFLLFYFGQNAGIVPSIVHKSNGLLWTAVTLLVVYALTFSLAAWRMQVKWNRELEDLRLYVPSRPEPTISVPSPEPPQKSWWDLFKIYVKAKKEDVCPLVEFVD